MLKMKKFYFIYYFLLLSKLLPVPKLRDTKKMFKNS